MQILIATDGSDFSRAAAEMLKHLPLPDDVQATVVTVAPEVDAINVQHQKVIEEVSAKAEQTVARQASELAELGWRVETHVLYGNAADQILETADKQGADLLVVGSHGWTGLGQFLLGSVASSVVKHANCSVLIGKLRNTAISSPLAATRDWEKHPLLKILLAYDGSPSANAAARWLASLPLKDRGQVDIFAALTVATTFYRMDITERLSAMWQERKAKLQDQLQQAAEILKASTSDVTTELRESGPDASHPLMEYAGEVDADLIVLGHKGSSAVKRFLLGSVADRVVHSAEQSVLVVRDRTQDQS